jgi:WD40 repeat protein
MIDIEVFARQLLKGKIEDVDREEEAVALLVRKTLNDSLIREEQRLDAMRTELQRLQKQHRKSIEDQLSQWERYCLRHAVRHLRRGEGEGTSDRVRELACDLCYVESKAQAGMAFELASEYQSTGSGDSGGAREGNAQGGMGRDEGMYSFYRFALEYGAVLNERPHLAVQCAGNWPDGLMPTVQAAAAGAELCWLRLTRKQKALGAELMTMSHGGKDGVSSVCFSSDGQRVVSGGKDGNVKVWDSASGEEQACIAHAGGDVFCSVGFSSDGGRVVTGDSYGNVKVWDSASGEEQACMAHGGGKVNSVGFSPDGRRVVSGGVDGNVEVWDSASEEEQMCMAHGGGRVNSVCFSSDGREVVSGGRDGNVKVWDSASGEKQACMAHGGSTSWNSVISLCFSSDGGRVVSGGQDGNVKVWDLASGEEQACIAHGGNVVWSVGFSPDGERVVSGDSYGNVKVWDSASGEEQACMAHGGGVSSVCFSSEGDRVVSGGNSGSVKVWDLASGEEQACIAHGGEDEAESRLGRQGHGWMACSVCFSLDGGRVAAGGNSGSVKVWDSASGEEQACMAHGGSSCQTVMSVCFSSDGQRVVSGGEDDNVKVWDSASGEEQACMAHGGDVVYSVCFSLDGGRVVSGGYDGNVKVWDSVSGEKQACMAHGGEGGVSSVCFSSDGGRVVAGGEDGNVKMWDSASGKEVLGGDADNILATCSLEWLQQGQRSRGVYRIEIVQDKSMLQLLMSTSEGDVEVGYIYLGRILDATFNRDGSIFVARLTLAPQVVEVVLPGWC